MIKDRPHRLDLVYFHSPLFFVTFCTRNRTKIPSLHLAQGAIENYARIGVHDFNIAIGRYVIMPDHVHFFVRGDHNFVLSTWVGGLKRARENPVRAGLVDDSANWPYYGEIVII